jgi:hypothetical protein
MSRHNAFQTNNYLGNDFFHSFHVLDLVSICFFPHWEDGLLSYGKIPNYDKKYDFWCQNITT